MKIDKTDWVLTSLADVCDKKEENDKLASAKGFDRFVKVEHLDADSLHIKRWGIAGEEELPPTFYKIFRKGQMLFPTRNPHLRRAALASFDGICGEKTLTLEPKKELISPEFFPFVFLAEAFTNHTTGAIIGSTNPHVRWRDVSDFKFFLPPQDQQKKLAELLWAGDNALQLKIELQQKLEGLMNVFYEKEFAKYKGTKFLSEVGVFFKGKGIAKSQVSQSGVPCVRYGELYTRHNNIVRNYYSFITKEVAMDSVKLRKNDVLLAGSGETVTEIGKSAAIIDDRDIYAGSDIIIFRPHDMNGVFLGYMLNSNFVRLQLNKLGKGATIAHIYPSDLETVKIKDLSLKQQEVFAEKVETIYNVIIKTQNHIEDSKEVQKQLIDQIFSN